MNSLGITTIELIASLAIMSIVISVVGPGAVKIHNRSKATAEINWLIGAINFSRHAAVNHRATVTLCPNARKDFSCNGKWQDGLIVFADYNRNARFDGKDFVIESVQNTASNGTLNWRAFRNRQYLQFTKYGYTNFQNGNFTYCPENQDSHFARQIVINTQGRARVVNSRDAAGYPIDRRGKRLRC